MENTATRRQRYALWCITKKDYRNVVISKEEASRLISELGDKDYKKSEKKSLTSQLEDYLVAHFEDIFKSCAESLKLKSVLEEDKPNDPNRKRYAFVGFGCGITYFTYRKNNKKAKEIDDAANKLLYGGKIEKMFLDKFTKKERDYYEKIGCPLEAIWYRDQNIQCACHYQVVKFSESVGVKMDYKSFLD